MVKQIQFHLDDDIYEKVDQAKDERDLTWPEFVERAIDALNGDTDN